MRDPPPNPDLVIPANWPKYGDCRGARIELRTEAPKMKPADLVDVYVVVPGVGKTRPWKGSDYAIQKNGDIAF